MKVRALLLGLALVLACPAAAAAATQAPATRASSDPTDCAASPHTCGYPDGTNTGVPPGVTLQSVPGQVSSGPGWHFDAATGTVVVDGDGAVLSGLDIPYSVDVSADNVTIANDHIKPEGQWGIALRHVHDVTITHTTVQGEDYVHTGIQDIYGDSTGVTITHDNISHASTGVRLEQGVIADNYIHHCTCQPTDHVNGVRSDGGVTAPLTIWHNTILIDHAQTDAVGLFPTFGVQANRVVAYNLLAGGGYTIYGGEKSGAPPAHDIKIFNNRISTIYFPHGGYYGPVAYFNASGPGNLWSGNTVG